MSEASSVQQQNNNNVISPGEYVLKKLFSEFVLASQQKLDFIYQQQLEFSLTKVQKGEDAQFDQLLCCLNEVSSFCLTSLLTSLFDWRNKKLEQYRIALGSKLRHQSSMSGVESAVDLPKTSSAKYQKEPQYERMELAIEFLFCLVLTEVLTKLSLHPVPETLIHQIEDLAFKMFKTQELKDRNPNAGNMKRVADLYGEVIGVLSQARFSSVRRRFLSELREGQNNQNTLVSIIEGMKFVRVKMFPVEEIEERFAFLQDCAKWFIDSKDRARQAMSSLLVDILLPVGAVIDLEASLPAVKKFVSLLFNHCVEQCRKVKHHATYIPLVTAILSICEKDFFLQNWGSFLNSYILPNLRKDAEIQRVVLESLYRLLWVYVVRIKCEGNIPTENRLRLIVDNLFPKSTRGVQPKDAPLTIFVKVIQFIARARLKYAMNDVILDLVSIRKGLNPERINIGLRAFIMIADNLEKNEGDPPMPVMSSSMPSGSAPRVKTKFLNNTLTEEIAKGLGLVEFYPAIKKALDNILRALDASVGKNMLSIYTQAYSRSQSDLLTGERKPKLDLLKTCVAAIPRIMPEGMSREELVELLSRLTIHIDHELAKLAFTSLQNMITNYPSWGHEIARGYVLFILRDIPDSCPMVMESSLKMLGSFLTHWKSTLTAESAKTVDDPNAPQNDRFASDQSSALHWVEALSLLAFCSYRPTTRRLSVSIMKEAKSLLELLGHLTTTDEEAVADIVDKVTPTIIERYLNTLSTKEAADLNSQNLTLLWLADRRTSLLEEGGSRKNLKDAWSLCISGLLDPSLLPLMCPTAIHCIWQSIVHRMQKVFQVIDPGFSVGELSHKGSTRGRKTVTAPTSSIDMFLWRSYLIFAACTAPPIAFQESYSTPVASDSSSGIWTARDLFRFVVPMLYYEGEIKEVATTALGLAHPQAFGDLIEELHPLMREVMDRKHENSKRVKRRKDQLRVQITRVLELAAENGCFKDNPLCIAENGSLGVIFLDFVESVRVFLESESDRDFVASLQELRLRFSGFISNLINSYPRGEKRLRLFAPNMRFSLFFLFSTWCGYFGSMSDYDTRTLRNRRGYTNFSITALQAMSALLCCGPVFDPQGLAAESYLYQWLQNMLHSNEPKIQKLGRKTVQLLLYNNRSTPVLLQWVTNQCYSSNFMSAQQCFHALSNVLAYNANYPCDMISILHVVLYKTADPEHHVRERAAQLLHILDKRFFGGDDDDRPELMGCISGTYSNAHIVLSRELASSNPELTLPLFSEMVYRFEMAPQSGQRSILQYMVPWLHNVELLDHHRPLEDKVDSTNQVLQGSGWGSREGTRLVLHNLLYITAKYGNDHTKEVEQLWCALCCWKQNIRIALDFLVYLSVGAGSTWLLEQAKKVVVFLGRANPTHIVKELMKELESVELVHADLELLDRSPYVNLKTETKLTVIAGTDGDQSGSGYSHLPAANLEPISGASRAPTAGREWLATWRLSRKMSQGQPVPLPLPANYNYYANITELLHKSHHYPILHRCNFALIFLSELVIDLNDISWSDYLPQLLHILCLGLDLHRPLVFEHSKKLLINLVIFLACKEDKVAATRAKVTHQELSLRSPSIISLYGEDGMAGSKRLSHAGSLDSLIGAATSLEEGNLSSVARDLVRYISEKSASSPAHWPFEEMLVRGEAGVRVADVENLENLVGRILGVFQGVMATQLQRRWSEVALRWATSCSSRLYASKSFQICRALHIPLSVNMFSDVLTRLAENAADHNEDVQNYVMELLLTLEIAVDYTTDEQAGDQQPPTDEEIAIQSTSVSPVPVAPQMGSNTVSHALSALDVNVMAAAATCPTQTKPSASPSRSRTPHRHSRGPSITRISDIIADHTPLQSHDATSKLVVTLKQHQLQQQQQQQQQTSTTIATGDFSSHYVSPKHQSAVDGHMIQPVVSEVAPRYSPPSTRKANSAASTPNRSPTHRRYRQTETKLEPPGHRHSDAGDPRKGHDHASIHRKMSEHSPQLGRKHQRPASWMGGNSATSQMKEASGKGSQLHKIVSESRMMQHKLEHKSISSSRVEGSRSHHGSTVTLDNVQAGVSGLLAQLFWTSASLLESDYEQEFAMAMRLLNKAMDKLDLQSKDIKEKLKSLLEKLTWPTFPGVQSLLLKGLGSSSAEAVLKLLARITPLSTHPVFDPTEFAGFPLNVMSLMPLMMKQFDDPDKFCITCATNIHEVCTTMSNEELKERLINMAAMFDMYSTKRYTKPVELWAAAVCRYLSSAYPSVTTSVLRLLVEMLEKGPAHYHKSVLRLIYEYLKLSDRDSSDIIAMNQQILSAVEAHIKGSLWREACEILKFAVSDSATLVAPPTRVVNLPLVDIGSQPLPGPTLQFSIDLDKGSRDLELIRDINNFSAWKKPQTSQRRTRERLLSVLNTCGAAMTTNPSVIFDDESITQYSSVSEGTSIRDEQEVNSTRDSEMLENSQPESQIFTNMINDQFNFLDQLDDMDTSSVESDDRWRVRRYSSADEFDELRQYNQSDVSVDSLTSPEPTARMMSKAEQQDTGPISIPILDHDDDDDDDDDRERIAKRGRDSTHSSRESLPQVLPTHQPLVSEFINISYDEIEEYWREHVSTTLRDKSGVVAINTFFLFNKLFMVIRQRFINLTKETCNYLEKGFKHLMSHYLNAVEVLANQFECPKVFIDAELFSVPNLLEQHVFHVMEIQSNIIQYMEKRKAVIECLTKYKAKLQKDSCEQLLLDSPIEYSHKNSEQSSSCGSPLPLTVANQRHCEEALHLCQALYQFHFQLLVLLGNYVKLLNLVNDVTHSDKATDVSDELTDMQSDVESALALISSSPTPSEQLLQQQQQFTENVTIMNRHQAIRKLEELLNKKQTVDCIHYLHCMRKRWKGDVFGSSEEDDVDALFSIYSKYLVYRTEGVLLCMTHHKHNLFEVHNRLMALNVTLRSMLDVEEAAYHEMNERVSSGLISASPSAYELVDNVDTVLPVAADNLSSPDRNASPLSFDPPPPVLSDYASNDEEPLDNYEDHMSSTNIIVKVENVDDDSKDEEVDDKEEDDDIDELVVPLPPADSNSSHDNDDKDDDNEPAATSSSHELSVSPDQLPREQDDTPADQSSSTPNDTLPEEIPEQASGDIVPQEQQLPPASADNNKNDTNLLTSI